MNFLRIIALSLVLTGNSSAFTVWSGEFTLLTKDNHTIGFVGTFPTESATCARNAYGEVIHSFTAEQIEKNFDPIVTKARNLAIERCDLK